MREIRADVGVDAGASAGAVVLEAREATAVDQPEVVLGGAFARSGVGTEPGLVSVRAARGT